MTIQREWDKSRLVDYLKFDYWESYPALCLLAGFDYFAYSHNRLFSDFGATDTLDLNTFLGGDNDQYDIDVRICEMKKIVDRLADLWEHTKHGEDESFDQYSPSYYIEWSISKGIKPEWLDWAIECSLYVPKQENETTTQVDFDKTSITYPPELDIAIRAWSAVSITKGKSKPKARIKAWLDKNTKLSNEAKERIATVANWDKTGGAARSD